MAMDRSLKALSLVLSYPTVELQAGMSEIGGVLASQPPRGRLEFRLAPNGQHILAAIHEFVPRLPWYIYIVTQAIAHLFVMWRFGAHLAQARPELPGSKPLELGPGATP